MANDKTLLLKVRRENIIEDIKIKLNKGKAFQIL